MDEVNDIRGGISRSGRPKVRRKGGGIGRAKTHLLPAIDNPVIIGVDPRNQISHTPRRSIQGARSLLRFRQDNARGIDLYAAA